MLKVLEATIAIVAILAVFIVTYRGESMPETETANWRYYGYQALQTLDNAGILAYHALNDDNSGLNNSLSILMPAGISYDTVICTPVCDQPKITAEKVASVNYYVPGSVANFSPREIVLYMWSS